MLADKLIPLVEMRRGTTYRFLVNGGEDHALYLTTSPDGGYDQLDPDQRAQETLLAGINILNQNNNGGVTEFESTAAGPLCLYTETGASEEATNAGYQAYFSTLDTSCASDENLSNAAGVLEFTPDDTTPNVIYYQSVTHPNLGGEIQVINADEDSILDVNCDNFGSSPIELNNQLTLNTIVDPIQNTMTVELVLDAVGWVAMASTNGQANMIGAEAVIGLPDEEENTNTIPAKYNLNRKDVPGIVQMPPDQQTLFDATVAQIDGKTRMKFTKLLIEDGEHPIFTDISNTFLFAYGNSITLALHTVRNSFQLLPNQCAVRVNGELVNENALNQQEVDDAGDDYRELWVAHGVCAAMAWGILVPLAIGASLIRKLLVKIGLPKSAWFQIHRSLNTLAAILTIIAFALAVRAINLTSSDPNHFDPDINVHRRTGLVIFILTLGQAINGILRPHQPYAKQEEEQATEAQITTDQEKKDNTKHAVEETETTSVEEDPNRKNTPASSVEGGIQEKKEGKDEGPKEQVHHEEEKSLVRKVWEVLHRLLGLTLLGFTWWQVQDGLGLFAFRFQEDNLDTVFWIVVSSLSGSLVAMAIFSRVALK